MTLGNNLLRNTTIGLSVIILLAVLLFAVVGRELSAGADNVRVRALAEAGAGHRAAGIGAVTRALNTQLRALAMDSEMVALSSGNAVIEEHEVLTRVAAGFTGAVNSRLVSLTPLGIADDEFDSQRIGSNIIIDLIGRAFSDKQPNPEIYQQQDRWLISVAAPVRLEAGSPPTGVLLTTIDAAELLAEASIGEAGELVFFSGGREIFRQGSGATELRSNRISVPNLPMSLEYSPSVKQLQQTRVSFTPWLAAAVIAGIVLLAATVMGLLRIRKQLLADVQTLKQLTKQRASTASAPLMSVNELAPLATTIEELVRRITNAQGGGSPAGKPSAASENPDSLDPLAMLINEPAGDDDDDSLELELDEPVEIPAEIFRAYDIRGLARKLSDPLAQMLGCAIGSEVLMLGQQAVVVGADGRDSSPRIRDALVKGLLESGCDVIDIGTVATPMLYFAAHHLQTQSAIMVTGSHHGAEFNGLKMLMGGESPSVQRIQALRQRVENEDFASGQGSYRVSDVNSDYVQAVGEDIVVSENPRIVVDCGNGAAAVIATELFESLGATVIPLFGDLDGSFPNRAPDPSNPENMRHLSAAVKEHKAELGVAFDGDGDRLGVVDGSGRIIAADWLLMLFARDLLSRHPGADVVFDVKCSRHLARVISDAGGRPIMWCSGHSLIKSKMKEVGALLGGEYTGHICFSDRWFGFDDALYSAARLLEIVGLEGRILADLVAELPQSVSTAEILLPVEEDSKASLLERVAELLQFDDAKLITLDGVRVEFADGWGLVRASNTEAALSLRFEADDADALARIRGQFREQLATVLDPDILKF